MGTPEIASKAGMIDDDIVIYIEDYALQYIKILKQEVNSKEDKFILYGKKERIPGKEVYIIYGAGRMEEEKELCFRGAGRSYERIGSLDMTLWEQEKDIFKGLQIGMANSKRPVRGYYVFYDADDKMKDCLSKYYEESINRSRYITQRGQGALEQAELVDFGSNKQTSGASLYIWIRITVIGILAILCAIAVTTINGYDKISDFVQAAVQTAEMIEKP